MSTACVPCAWELCAPGDPGPSYNPACADEPGVCLVCGDFHEGDC